MTKWITLTVQAPDDWKYGECCNCPFCGDDGCISERLNDICPAILTEDSKKGEYQYG